ncbi:hypothetical protein CIPAW_08G145700 [Carya illinoinensis]|uniref:Uncharacterized protein n=1 Tax=Carya illinoinensis TaxID=32201 RepID=A0A8T1PWJ5_CARIL|nr:hypothetical protein CIPAW_08G145700 [Carya illinoinensis]
MEELLDMGCSVLECEKQRGKYMKEKRIGLGDGLRWGAMNVGVGLVVVHWGRYWNSGF